MRSMAEKKSDIHFIIEFRPSRIKVGVGITIIFKTTSLLLFFSTINYYVREIHTHTHTAYERYIRFETTFSSAAGYRIKFNFTAILKKNKR